MNRNDISRRSALKLLAVSSVGVNALGYWTQGIANVENTLNNSTFNTLEQNLISAAADTIIPKGESWGAVELGVPLYLIRYFDQCLEEPVQKNIKVQLKSLEKRSVKQHNASFEKCDQKQREALLLTFSNSNNEGENDFFNLLKSQTVHGFRHTEEVSTGPYRYRIAPGHFKGCIDINSPSVS